VWFALAVMGYQVRASLWQWKMEQRLELYPGIPWPVIIIEDKLRYYYVVLKCKCAIRSSNFMVTDSQKLGSSARTMSNEDG
jgi:hypothetical protein